MLYKLAFKSLSNRKSTVLLSIVSITMGIMMLIAFSFISGQVKSSFAKTVSGIDLIVGAKTSEVNLLLYAVFHMGAPADNIAWDTYQSIDNDQLTDWTIPISLGDSHLGFRVIGTNQNYFEHFRYGNHQPLSLDSGEWFDHPFEVVLGHEVASKSQYQINDLITLSHGVSHNSFTQHDQIQFKVSGILANTGTAVDQSLFVSLSGLEAIHLNWPKDEAAQQQLIDYIVENGLTPQSITAIFLALKSKSSTFVMQRRINQDKTAPLQAILPGVALAQIWRMSKTFEQVLWLVGVLVFVSTIIGLVNTLMASLQSRKKELALLRIIGASPFYCFLLIQLESFLMLLAAMLLAGVLCWLLFYLFSDWLGSQYGFFIELGAYVNSDLLLIFGAVLVTAVLLICIPAAMYYRQSILKNINQ